VNTTYGSYRDIGHATLAFRKVFTDAGNFSINGSFLTFRENYWGNYLVK
jgi:hypothetical protein